MISDPLSVYDPLPALLIILCCRVCLDLEELRLTNPTKAWDLKTRMMITRWRKTKTERKMGFREAQEQSGPSGELATVLDFAWACK